MLTKLSASAAVGKCFVPTNIITQFNAEFSIVSEQSVRTEGHGRGSRDGGLDLGGTAAHHGLLFLRSHVGLWVSIITAFDLI